MANDPWLNKTTRNISKSSGLHDDLKAELFVILCDKEADYIIAAVEKGYFKWMVVRILQTMFHSPRHPFFITYRYKPPTCAIGGANGDDGDDGDDRALMVPDAEADIDEILEYNRREAALLLTETTANPILLAIWNRYKKTKSAQEVSRHFDVPHSYIRRQLKEFKDKLQINYNSHI